MRIKSFYARTVEAAMAAARQELGPDALLLNSRKAPEEANRPGEYEVTFAIEERPPLPAAEPPAARPPAGNLAADVALLRKELEGMRRAMTRSAFAPPSWMGAAPEVSDAYAALTANEVSPDLARRIVQSAEARAGGSKLRTARMTQHAHGPGFQQALVSEIEAQFKVDAGLAPGGARRAIVAFVGPPGAGKTTTLVKLAVNYGLALRRSVHILSLDTYRIGAAEQLRSYAAILGVGFQVFETVGALARAIEENGGKDLTLIDSPGLAAADLECAAELATFLETRGDIGAHLVLPASMKPSDMGRTIDAYSVLHPARLLFTRLDETSVHGAILTEAARTGKPLSFFTTGQRIPEDIEEVTPARLIGMALAGQGGKSRTAA